MFVSAIHCFDRHPVLKKPGSLNQIRNQNSIHQKSRTVFNDNWKFAHFFREFKNRGHCFIAGLFPTDHFHQWHFVNRVEKVHSNKILWVRVPLRHFCDGQRRRICRNDAIWPTVGSCFGDDFLLYTHIFNDRFNNYVELLEASEIQSASDLRHLPIEFVPIDFFSLNKFIP